MRLSHDFKLDNILRGLEMYPPEIERISSLIDGPPRDALLILADGKHSFKELSRKLNLNLSAVGTVSYYLRSHGLARIDVKRDFDGTYAGSAIFITLKGREVRKLLEAKQDGSGRGSPTST